MKGLEIPIVGLALLVGPGCRDEKPAGEPADVAAVRQLMVQFDAALNNGDMDEFISLWTDDSIQFFVGSPPLRGKDAIRAVVEGPLDDYVREVASTEMEEIQVMGDWAYGWGTYEASLTHKGTGETLVGSGTFLNIFKRQADGTWKLHRDMSTGVPQSRVEASPSSGRASTAP